MTSNGKEDTETSKSVLAGSSQTLALFPLVSTYGLGILCVVTIHHLLSPTIRSLEKNMHVCVCAFLHRVSCG